MRKIIIYSLLSLSILVGCSKQTDSTSVVQETIYNQIQQLEETKTYSSYESMSIGNKIFIGSDIKALQANEYALKLTKHSNESQDGNDNIIKSYSCLVNTKAQKITCKDKTFEQVITDIEKN